MRTPQLVAEAAEPVVTSPPCPGVYVLYHRWKVRGRKESPAPFWVADCQDGQGQAHYCFGHRKQQGLTSYFSGIQASFAGAAGHRSPCPCRADGRPSREGIAHPRYLESMDAAGFNEVLPEVAGAACQ